MESEEDMPKGNGQNHSNPGDLRNWVSTKNVMPDPPSIPSPCTWTLSDPDMDAWETDCGHLFVINCGTPSEHSMKFCCYCGGLLEECRS